MKIAVIGAGFLGLACAYELSAHASVTLFDKQGIGAGASGMAAGLLHPFAGKKATLNWRGLEGYKAACCLLDVAEDALGKKVSYKTGIFRPACTEEQKELFSASLQKYPEHLTWQTYNEAFFEPLSGIFIPSGIQVDCPLYLEGLYQALLRRGVFLQIAYISSIEELDDFDLVVYTVGCGFNSIKGLEKVSIHVVKGQLLEFSCNHTLAFAVSSECYVAQIRPGSLVAGSTYEHSPQTEAPDKAACEQKIRSKIALFSKTLAALPIRDCKAGLRATTPDKKPFITKVGPKHFCLGGLGSKGLLYHALIAKELVESVGIVKK
jgi:glycine/D-amino acid oxidase-like deaminating enzyme